MPTDPRHTRAYKVARGLFRAAGKRINAPCWLDGRPIDYTLPRDHPDSWSLDHAIPVAERPDLALDPTNFRHSHLACNKRRGNKQPFIPIGRPSRNW